MPPCVRMSPSSTVMLPGPTCFQPARSLPLKSGFQAGVCGCAAANANRVETAATASIVIQLRGVMASCSSEKSSQAKGTAGLGPYNGKSKLQRLEIVVTDFYVVSRSFGVVL